MQLNDEAIARAASDALPAGLISLYLFGSHAAGRAHRDSDLDLAALLDHSIHRTRTVRFEARVRLASRLPAVTAGMPVDVVILNDAPPQLARRILIEGRRLLCTDEEQDHVARRVALTRAADIAPFLRRMRALKLDAITP